MTGDRGDGPPEVGSTPDHRQSAFVYDLDVGEAASEGVVAAVSAVANRPPTRLAPLYRTLDTDALDSLSARGTSDPTNRTVDVTFDYEGYTVTVDGANRILVCE